jgi:hypothetical protein
MCWMTENFCLISDRHKEIVNVGNRQSLWQEPMVVHRFCLRYIRSNFNAKFRNHQLMKLMYVAGDQSKKYKFLRIMEEINMLNPLAKAWLDGIPNE